MPTNTRLTCGGFAYCTSVVRKVVVFSTYLSLGDGFDSFQKFCSRNAEFALEPHQVAVIRAHKEITRLSYQHGTHTREVRVQGTEVTIY